MNVQKMNKLFLIGTFLFSGIFLSGLTYSMETITNIKYAKIDARNLLLNLYLPDNNSHSKLIIWVHGGAWSFGSKEDIQILDIVDQGFAVASVGFRNSPEAPFPAQVHDIRGAIRYLRAQANKYSYDANNIAIWGYSSGGHLAALVGTTNGNPILEGEVGGNLEFSSDVQAILDFSGPSNFQTILHQSTPHGISVRAPALESLLGKPVDDPSIQEIVILASPVFQVNENDPPLLIMHGVQDNQVPINQSLELQDAYLKAGLPVEVNWVVEASHTSGEFFTSPYLEQAADFINRSLSALD